GTPWELRHRDLGPSGAGPRADRGSALAAARVIRCARVRDRDMRRASRASHDVLEDTMSTRREFVEGAAGAAGIAFVACNLTGVAPVQAQGRRREVVVNGRRVKTVDVHAHCAVPEAMALLGRNVEPQTLLMSQPADRIRAMDEQGIDVEALSINPYWYRADRDVAREIIRIQNEKLAEACAA